MHILGLGFAFAQTATPENMPYTSAINLLRQPNTYYPVFFGTGIGTSAGRFPDSTAIVLGNHNDTIGPNGAEFSVAIGHYAGQNSQGTGAIAMGDQAGLLWSRYECSCHWQWSWLSITGKQFHYY